MASKKVQAEIDRTLKKVQEGMEMFEDIWQKVHAADKVNMKEKWEAELKKEIKKLQRYRDQIKSWAASSEIKNKAPLLEARKAIEGDMERFKVCEKEAKTKAYSKEALAAPEKRDGDIEPEKLELKDWIDDMIALIRVQLVEHETEFQKFSLKSKGRKRQQDKDRYSKLQKSIDRYNWHISQLNLAWEKLVIDQISVDNVEAIRDDLEYWIENNQEQDVEDSYIYSMLEEDLPDEDEIDQSAIAEFLDVELEPEVEEEKEELPVVVQPQPSPQPSKKNPKPKKVEEVVSPVSEPQKPKPSPQAEIKTQPAPKPVKPSVPPAGAEFASIVKRKPANVPPSGQPIEPKPIKILTNPHTAVKPSSIDEPRLQPLKNVQPLKLPEEKLAHKLVNLSISKMQKPVVTVPEVVQKTLEDEYSYYMQMLESGMDQSPQQKESQKKPYTPRNPLKTPEFFPSAPAQIFDDTRIFDKFDMDTLFFIFYFQQGSYQQFLAAKQLKRQSWRYHTKYLTWFQRHDDPKVTTDEYEQGTYVYFDYDFSWCQRIKTNFTFEYNYLEDELPI